jgi:hypothetical protein
MRFKRFVFVYPPLQLRITLTLPLSTALTNLHSEFSPEHIGRLVNFRAREWGEGGMDLNILDITKEYIDIEMPQEYIDTGFNDVGTPVDGKNNNTDTYRLESALSRAQCSSKKHSSACRTMGYLTPAGLTVEHTPAYWARASETALEALWGSHRGMTPDREMDELGEPVTMLPLSRRVRYNVPAHNRTRDVRRQESIQRRIQSLPAPAGYEAEDDLQSDAGLDAGDIAEAPQNEATQALQARFMTQLGGLDIEDVDDQLEGEAQAAHLLQQGAESPSPAHTPFDSLSAWADNSIDRRADAVEIAAAGGAPSIAIT